MPTRLSPMLRRVLNAVPSDAEVELGALVFATGLSLDEALAGLAQLVELQHIAVREERRADLLVRLYRRF